MQKSKIILCLLVAATAFSIFSSYNRADSTENKFEQWKGTYNVKYSSSMEEQYRKIIFMANVEKVTKHNADPFRTYDMGINQFADITGDEFVARYLSDIDVAKMKQGKQKVQVQFQGIDTIDDVDWVQQGAVTRVKTQGQCAASWAFSASGALQGLSKIAYGTLRTFSDQQLLDCSGVLCSCSGGFADMAFRYVESSGLCDESVYPYAQVKQSCKYMPACTFKVSDYDYVDNCNMLGKVIGMRPISVAVQASNWPLYKSGVFSNCGTKVNYMALLVGVVDGNWKVKNSLGETWGQQGYIRLAPGNTCGICGIGLYPIK